VWVACKDGLAYLAWLGELTAEHYSPPSESHWEYAARVGSASPQPWEGGLAIACSYINGAGRLRADLPHLPPLLCCDDGDAYTSPASAFPPNALGIAHQIGNMREWVAVCEREWVAVREWVADCHLDTLEQMPANGAIASREDCEYFSLRGASFDYPIGQLRSAVRDRYPPDVRYPNVDFRVARTLRPPPEVLPESVTGVATITGPAYADRHMVVAANPLAARAALEILAADGSLMSFAESVPGGRAVAVPSMVRLMETMHRDHGRLRWAQLFQPAIRVAEQGFEVSPRLEQLIDYPGYLSLEDLESYQVKLREPLCGGYRSYRV
jgi:hypothetical protein